VRGSEEGDRGERGCRGHRGDLILYALHGSIALTVAPSSDRTKAVDVEKVADAISHLLEATFFLQCYCKKSLMGHLIIKFGTSMYSKIQTHVKLLNFGLLKCGSKPNTTYVSEPINKVTLRHMQNSYNDNTNWWSPSTYRWVSLMNLSCYHLFSLRHAHSGWEW
jgi:4-hydroxy-L-threonine phosphate dehydrogenase PdxA